MSPGSLDQVLQYLPAMRDPNLLVGLDSVDDAGVYRLSPDLALIQTMDFFTPIVDDPYLFGQIAAANALSDVYAMGGQPLTAMNIVAFPAKKLAIEILGQILRGGADKVLEAGAVLVGGHSIEDSEPKYGLSVTGVVHPERVVTNSGARAGDKLILTKPLGTGVLTTAIKGGAVGPEVEAMVASVMAALNRPAAEAMQAVGVHACTDITGFGFLGHALEMANGSKVALSIAAAAVPLLPGVAELAAAGLLPGGAHANRRFVADRASFGAGVSQVMQLILADPQTSGGLLIAVAGEKADALLGELFARGVTGALVGEVVAAGGTPIRVE